MDNRAEFETAHTIVSPSSRECEPEVELRITQEELQSVQRELSALQKELQELQTAYSEISHAFFWKISKPIRKILDYLKPRLRKYAFIRLPFHALKYAKRHGAKAAIKRGYSRLTSSNRMKVQFKKERSTQFPLDIKFSILVPLYNTPENFLREMIHSVQGQSYINWELCLADGSDEQHTAAEPLCNMLSKKDKRIRYQKLERNLGISENTNACIQMSEGDYIVLLDHDDLLHPSALYEVMCAICEKGADFIYTDETTFRTNAKDAFCPHYKPDFAPDTLRSYNYICHLTAFKKTLLDEIGGGFRSKCDGSQDYDLVLRLTEKAKHIVHIPKVLYFWRSHKDSVAFDISVKPYTVDAAKKALTDHLERIGLKGKAKDSSIRTTYKIEYQIEGTPLISILIPNKDHAADLMRCVNSIRTKSTYSNWEIIIIENNSTKQTTFDYYEQLKKDKRIHVVIWNGEFNYSAINNFGVQAASGDYYLMLNNDMEIITPDWLEQMLMFAQRSDIGAVGSMLYYPDDTIQHAGVVFGMMGVAGHAHRNFPRYHSGYFSRLTIAQNYSAVTAACLMMRKTVFDEIGGFEEALKVDYNDVDLCMRIRKAGYLIVWTPYAELYHCESKSRGNHDSPEKKLRFENEHHFFTERWNKELKEGDPYYNPNFNLDREDFSIKQDHL